MVWLQTAPGYFPRVVNFISPDGDHETSDWTATPLWSKIDGTIADDTEVIQSTEHNLTSSSTYDFTVTLSDPSVTPSSSQTHEINVRTRRVDVTGSGHTYNIKVELLELTTVIATREFTAITTNWELRGYDLSAGEIASISNYNDLRLRITATLQLSLDFEGVRAEVSWAQVRFI